MSYFLKSKEESINKLLSKADEYSEDTSQRAMARSLADMWREVNDLEKKRCQIIDQSLQFYQSAEEVRYSIKS